MATDPSRLTDLGALLLGQWQSSPRIRGLMVDAVGKIRDDAVRAADRFVEMLDLDNAGGVWLDLIGKRIGLRRPSTTNPAADVRFGYDMAGVGFDQQPFRGVPSSDAVFPLPDAVYRSLLKARVVALVGDGTIHMLDLAIKQIDPTATTQDLRNMQVRVVTSMRSTIELADELDALPRTAGVELLYRDRGRFGYDQAGVGFDQGPFV